MTLCVCLGCGMEIEDSEVVGGGHVVIVNGHARDASCSEGECANCPVPEQELCGPVVDNVQAGAS